MVIYVMTEAVMQLAQIIWEREPLHSGELVKLAAERLNLEEIHYIYCTQKNL